MIDESGATRRSFYKRAVYGMGALITAMLSAPAAAYLMLPPRREEESSWADGGDISSVKSNEPVEIVFQQIKKDGWKRSVQRATAWIVKTEDGVVAYHPRCTHLGCGYHWEGDIGEFVCPCHASNFAMSGEVLTGPAPRPLDRFETRIKGSRLWLGAVVQSTESRADAAPTSAQRRA